MFLSDIADLGQPPDCYDDAEAYHADVQRLGEIVAKSGAFSEVEDYARWICSHAAGAASVLAFSTATPNFCWDMDRDSPFYAVECFTEDVSDAASAIESESPTADDEDNRRGDDPVSQPAAAPPAESDLAFFVFLDDGDTYSSLDGCLVVGIRAENRRAWRALDPTLGQ